MILSDSSDDESQDGDMRRAHLKKALRNYMAASLTHHENANANSGGNKASYRHCTKRRDYWSFAWGRMLLSGRCADETTREGKYFRRRFRVPYFLFTRIVQATRDAGVFDESHRSAPLEVLHYFNIMAHINTSLVKNFICATNTRSRGLF